MCIESEILQSHSIQQIALLISLLSVLPVYLAFSNTFLTHIFSQSFPLIVLCHSAHNTLLHQFLKALCFYKLQLLSVDVIEYQLPLRYKMPCFPLNLLLCNPPTYFFRVTYYFHIHLPISAKYHNCSTFLRISSKLGFIYRIVVLILLCPIWLAISGIVKIPLDTALIA